MGLAGEGALTMFMCFECALGLEPFYTQKCPLHKSLFFFEVFSLQCHVVNKFTAATVATVVPYCT